MQIVVGKLAGFCSGVKASVLQARKQLAKGDVVYCFGEIVHNQQVVNSLEEDGMIFVSDINDIPNGSVVIFRAHGVEEKIYEMAEEKGLEVVDLTCPSVLRIHDEAKELNKDGYYIILIAQVNHPETIGTISFCGEDSFVLEDEMMLDDLKNRLLASRKKKIAVLTQTTFSVDKYNKLVLRIEDLFREYELEIRSNICDATEKRQEEMKKMSKMADAMIVIGGKNSSNTKKLYEIGVKECKECYFIEKVEDLDIDLFGKKIIGIMAGSSTPQESIDEVVKYLNR